MRYIVFLEDFVLNLNINVNNSKESFNKKKIEKRKGLKKEQNKIIEFSNVQVNSQQQKIVFFSYLFINYSR